MTALRPSRDLRDGRTAHVVQAGKSAPLTLSRRVIERDTPNLRLTSVVAAAGLGQAAADQVTNGQQGHQEPALVGTEPLSVRIDVDHQGGDQNTQYRKYVHDQFGRLKRGLGLSAETAIAVSRNDGSAAGG